MHSSFSLPSHVHHANSPWGSIPTTVDNCLSQLPHRIPGFNSRGNGGRICFFAEAWKATSCDAPTALRFSNGDRIADKPVCLSKGDWRAIEAIMNVEESSSSQARTNKSNQDGRHTASKGKKSGGKSRRSQGKIERTSLGSPSRRHDAGHHIVRAMIGYGFSAHPRTAEAAVGRL